VIQEIAYRRHVSLHEKYESLIEGCYSEGVQIMFYYHFESIENVEAIPQKAAMDTCYSVVKQSRNARKKFLATMVHLMDVDYASEDMLLPRPNHLDFVIFIVDNLSMLGYATAEEVHHVMFNVDKILSGNGLTLLHETDCDLSLQENWRRIGNMSSILCVIWQLKSNLKGLYGISEAKCRAFNPSQLGKAKDLKTAVRQSRATATLASSEMRTAQLEDEQSARTRFRQFESLMTEGPADFET